jgi:hypothetical protein
MLRCTVEEADRSIHPQLRRAVWRKSDQTQKRHHDRVHGRLSLS